MNTIDQIKHESMRQCVAWINGQPITRAELSAAFDMVADPDNWMNSVYCYLDLNDEEVELVREAVVFFTGSIPTFQPMRAPSKPPRRYYLITADGYYATVMT